MIRYNSLCTLTPFRETPCKSTSRNGKQTSPLSPTLPPKILQIGTQNTVIYDPLLRTQKTPENAHSMGFSGVRESISFRSLLIDLLRQLPRRKWPLHFLTCPSALRSFHRLATRYMLKTASFQAFSIFRILLTHLCRCRVTQFS